MEFNDIVRSRRMCRDFDGAPIPPATLDRVLGHATRAPSAGNTQGWRFVLLEGQEQTDRYWAVTLPEERRRRFPWQGLLRAPVLVVAVCDPDAYVRRYAEPDKASTGLGEGEASWPVPYWQVDCAFAVMTMLLSAVDVGLGALFFGLFEHEEAVLAELGAPPGHRAIGTVALGWPTPDDRASSSAARGRLPLGEVVLRGGWSPPHGA